VEIKSVNAPRFYGSYELKVDAKNRMFVPANVRRVINPDVHGRAFFVILGKNKKPWFYPDLFYRTLVDQLTLEMSPDDDLLEYERLRFGLSDLIEWDDQGRVVLPEKALRRAGIENDVTLVGVWDHLELWNRAEWDAHTEQLVSNSGEIESKGKKAMLAAKQREGISGPAA
jgi:transcriptional regulator MraZ